jgi:hypothetical protein
MIGFNSYALHNFGESWQYCQRCFGLFPRRFPQRRAQQTQQRKKIMKKLLLVLGIAISLSGTSSVLMGSPGAVITSDGSRFDVFTYWIRGPIRTNSVTDAAYDPFATAVVSELYTNRTLQSRDVGHHLNTEYVTQQTANRTNETLHLAVRVVGRNGAKVSGTMLEALMGSSDTANTLSNAYSIASVANPVYSAKMWGVTYGPGGERISDSLLRNSEPASTLVDEIVFVGMQCKYYTYTDVANYAQIESYLTNYSPNFLLVGTWRVVQGTNVLGSAYRTLQVRGHPAQPVLSISDIDPKVRVGINMDTNRTANLYSSPKVPATGWKFEGTVNANDVLEQVKENAAVDDPGKMFYRAVLQPGTL